MKKKSVKLTKLSVNKATVANLSNEAQNKVAGGAATSMCSATPGCFSKICIVE